MIGKLGHVIRPGDYILRTNTLGRSPILQFAVVLEETEGKPNGWHRGSPSVVPKLRVMTVEDHLTAPGPRLLSTSSLIEFENRMIRLAVGEVPDPIRALLDAFAHKWWATHGGVPANVLHSSDS